MKLTPNLQLAASGLVLAAGVGLGLLLESRRGAADSTPSPASPAATNAVPASSPAPQPSPSGAGAPAPAGLPFSDWMGADDFAARLKGHEERGFWKDHWVLGVEGRVLNGVRQYRVAEGPCPQGTPYRWYWWYDMGEEFYQSRAAELRAKGFREVHHQSFAGEDGRPRHQGVWQKLGGD